jgi:hypothetical protein
MLIMAAQKLAILTFILLILTSSAHAYDFRDENIWIFKGMYELGPGERAELNEFTVKVHTVDTDSNSATLLLYINRDFKESYYVDTGANSEQIYNEELKIDVLDINNGIVSLEVHRQKYERVWITNIAKTSLGIGNSIQDGDYTVKLQDITEEGAKIEVKSDEGTAEDTYISGDHRKFSDEFMVHVIYVNKRTQEVSLETLRPGKPKIKIDTVTDKDSYESGETIDYQFMVTNNGTLPLHGLIVSTDSDEADVSDPEMQHSGLEPTKIKNFIIPLSAPVTPVAKTVKIESEVTAYDYKGNQYSGSGQTEVRIEPYISVEKSVEIVEKPDSSVQSGTEEYFRISISVENTADFPTAVTVSDVLDPSLIPYDLENTEWTLMVEADSVRKIEYLAKPTFPGKFTFEQAVVQWKDDGNTYTVESGPVEGEYLIHGSRIVVEKYVSPNYALPGEEVEVTVNIINAGSRKVEAILSDSVPGQFTMISGSNAWEGSLDAGESEDINYVLVTEATGKLDLGAAKVDYTDEQDQSGSSSSEKTVLYVDDMTESIIPEETAETVQEYGQDTEIHDDADTADAKPEVGRVEAAGFMVSSFITLFCILAIIPAIAYLYINRVYK